jgi:hypothetical protein
MLNTFSTFDCSEVTDSTMSNSLLPSLRGVHCSMKNRASCVDVRVDPVMCVSSCPSVVCLKDVGTELVVSIGDVDGFVGQLLLAIGRSV